MNREHHDRYQRVVVRFGHSSPLNDQATELITRWAEGSALVYLFWPVVMGYLRIATHAAVFEQPLSAAEATANVSALIARPTVRTAGETDGFWAI